MCDNTYEPFFCGQTEVDALCDHVRNNGFKGEAFKLGMVFSEAMAKMSERGFHYMFVNERENIRFSVAMATVGGCTDEDFVNDVESVVRRVKYRASM